MVGAGYTWGLSGPLFLLVYVVLAAAVGVAGTRARRALADVPVTRPLGDLAAHPYDVAYLNGGPALAVTAALSAMYRAGTIGPAGRGRVVAGERPDIGAHELERAIHRAAAVPPARHALPAVDALRSVGAVRSALDRIDSRLVEAGLLLDEERRRRIRGVARRTLAVAVLGVLRIVSGLAANRPVGYLVLALLVVVALAVLQWRRAPRRSRAGDAVLADLVQQHHALSPAMRPDWQVYGPAGAALSVGVFGVGALWAAEPAFAAEVAVARAGTGGWSDGASGGGSSWSGWSGGASGGGDSGGSGSSCGGGGGGCGGGGGGCGG